MKKSIQFVVLCCAVSWLVAGIAIFLGLRASSGLSYTIFGTSYMLLPAVCAIILQLIHKEKPFRNLGLFSGINRWFFIAGILPIVYSFMALGINLLLPGVSFSESHEGFLSGLPPEQAELAMR
jgi:hypothetical protein